MSGIIKDTIFFFVRINQHPTAVCLYSIHFHYIVTYFGRRNIIVSTRCLNYALSIRNLSCINQIDISLKSATYRV